MSGLRNLVFRKVEVQTSGGPLAVRGLSLDDFLNLYFRHGPVLAGLFDRVAEKVRDGRAIDRLDVTLLAIDFVSEAPQIVAEAIALASGSDASDELGFIGDAAMAKQLSAAEQIDALEKIAAQTFTSDMPPGKMFALIHRTIQAGSSASLSLVAQAD